MSDLDYLFDEAPHVMVIEARYFDDVADRLMKGTLDVLESAEATYEHFTVPGALEIPHAIKYAVRGLDFYTARKRFDAYIALGCVISGPDGHYDIISRESAAGLMSVALEHTLSIGNGIVACTSHEQAMELADPEGKMNAGGTAARTALDMLKLKSHFGIFPRN